MSSNVLLAALAGFSLLLQVSCFNDYGGCKPEKCEVRAPTDAGWLCGRLRKAEDGTPYASFRGVPYGKPPLGPSRFKELAPVEPWDGLYDATEDSPACPQTDFLFGRAFMPVKGQSEDCIYLNLHVPYSSFPDYNKSPWNYRAPYLLNNQAVPVIVYIHGGTLQSGSGLTDINGPEYLMTKPVILITFNFRLNVFGFMSLNNKLIPGNQGFRDILSLLKWVRRNVRSFGGDPNNITLMGQSMGASAAHLLSLSKAAKGLFHKLILMSGTAIPTYFTTSPRYAKKVANLFLKKVGINSTDPVYIHNELIKMPLLKIMDANAAVQSHTGFVSFNPVVETECHGSTTILDADPISLIGQGRAKNYPTIVGFTDKEMHFSERLLERKNTLAKVHKNPTTVVQPRLGYDLTRKQLLNITTRIYDRYFDENVTLDQLMTYYSDAVFKHAALKLAQLRVALDGAPLYLYKYSYEADFSPMKHSLWLNYKGAAHKDDLYSVFRVNSILGDYISSPPQSNDDYMKETMVRLVSDFVYDTTPICSGEESWRPVSKKDISYLNIDHPLLSRMSGLTDEEFEMVTFFDSIDPQVRNLGLRLGARWT